MHGHWGSENFPIVKPGHVTVMNFPPMTADQLLSAPNPVGTTATAKGHAPTSVTSWFEAITALARTFGLLYSSQWTVPITRLF